METTAYRASYDEGVHQLLRGVITEAPVVSDVPAAVLIPVYEDAGTVRLILIKRPMSMPTHGGHLAFPGGRPDDADADPVATALREAEEEVGISPEAVRIVGFLPAVDTVQYSLPVIPVVGLLDEVPELRPSPREVDAVLHPSLTALADESRWRCEVWRDHPVWFFDLDGEVLWGATAWMVRELLGLPRSCQ
jgi:8-oxo-dGTP pyrophosphatase MutT (NUDIX family)